jgi:hypothetical protein
MFVGGVLFDLSVNKRQRIPKGQFKKGKSSETGNTGHTRRKKTKLK